MKARKPKTFKVDGIHVAWCEVNDDDDFSRFVGTQRVYLGADHATRLAAWLTKAAAWCREGGK